MPPFAAAELLRLLESLGLGNTGMLPLRLAYPDAIDTTGELLPRRAAIATGAAS